MSSITGGAAKLTPVYAQVLRLCDDVSGVTLAVVELFLEGIGRCDAVPRGLDEGQCRATEAVIRYRRAK